ncbi:hypothetical protein [Amycolatopsis stemonae]
MTFVSRGFAAVVVDMAFDTTVLSSGGKAAPKPALAAQAQAGTGAPAR